MKFNFIRNICIKYKNYNRFYLKMPKPSKNSKHEESDHEETRNDETLDNNTAVAVQDNSEDLDTVTCDDFNVKRLTFKHTKQNKDATQMNVYPKYLYDQFELSLENLEKLSKSLVLVTGPIKMTKGGIPKHNPKFHTADPNSMKRGYFYIPKNDDDPNSVALFKCIKKIDDYMKKEINDEENKKGIIAILNDKDKKKPLGGYTYKPMITTAKEPENLDDDDDDDHKKKNKKPFVPWDRIKVKFSTEYDENLGPEDTKDINTQLYVGDREEHENCKKITDFEKEFFWQCTAEYALMFNKLWLTRQDKKECSIGIKAIQIHVTAQPDKKTGTSIAKQLNKRLFPSSGPLKIISTDGSSKIDDPDKDDKHKSAKEKEKDHDKKNKKSSKEDVDESEDEEKAGDPDEDEEKDKEEEVEEDEEEEEEDNEDESEPESEEEKPKDKKGGKGGKGGKVKEESKEEVKVKGKDAKKDKEKAKEKEKDIPKKKK